MSTIVTDLKDLYAVAFGYVGAPYPALSSATSLKNALVSRFDLVGDIQAQLGSLRKNQDGIEMISPVDFKDPEGLLEDFSFGYEPIVSIKSKNHLIRRRPQDSEVRGTIKEEWSQDDWSIKLQGFLVNRYEKAKPEEEMRRLLEYIDLGLVQIQSPITDIFDITRFAIENYEFGSTSSAKLQKYVLTGYSDEEDYSLFVD